MTLIVGRIEQLSTRDGFEHFALPKPGDAAIPNRKEVEHMNDQRTPRIGEAVVYVNPVGLAHPAVVTAVWSPACINLVFVSSDEAKGDSYGRQIERTTSLMHASVVPVHGNYWRFVDEAAKETEREQ